MEKETKQKFGKTYYLLGKRKGDNKKVWLEEGHFDCSWYWGIGYVEVFTHKYVDIEEHTHFDCLFFNNTGCCYDLFKAYFEETTLNDKEIWQLLENMKTLYNLRNYSDMIFRGGSHITTNQNSDLIKNEEEYKKINNVIIPKILKDIYGLLNKKGEN